MTGGYKSMKIEKANSWSDLPDDTISEIINRLHYVDQIRFRAVCKQWRAAINFNVVKYADKLPWIMGYNSSSCLLYDPYYKRQYTVYSGDTSTGRELAHTKVLDSKHGWVLFSKRTTSSVFFYNPFTNKMIQLPKLLISNLDHVGTFSTAPDCPDCMIFIFRPLYRNMFCISICKPGETRWTDFLFFERYGQLIASVEYLDGVFYCSFCPFAIGAFNAASKEWNLLPYPETGERFVTSNHLIKCDGDLLMAQYFAKRCQWCVSKFDLSQWNWFEVRSLENKSLFVSRVCMCLPAEDGSELANKIHLQYDEHPESHPLSSDIPVLLNHDRPIHYQFQAHRERRPSCPQAISQIYDWKEPGLNRFWIQLPKPR